MFFSGPQYVAAVIVGAEGVKRCITVAQESSYDNPQLVGTEGFSKVARQPGPLLAACMPEQADC